MKYLLLFSKVLLFSTQVLLGQGLQLKTQSWNEGGQSHEIIQVFEGGRFLYSDTLSKGKWGSELPSYFFVNKDRIYFAGNINLFGKNGKRENLLIFAYLEAGKDSIYIKEQFVELKKDLEFQHFFLQWEGEYLSFVYSPHLQTKLEFSFAIPDTTAREFRKYLKQFYKAMRKMGRIPNNYSYFNNI